MLDELLGLVQSDATVLGDECAEGTMRLVPCHVACGGRPGEGLHDSRFSRNRARGARQRTRDDSRASVALRAFLPDGALRTVLPILGMRCSNVVARFGDASTSSAKLVGTPGPHPRRHCARHVAVHVARAGRRPIAATRSVALWTRTLSSSSTSFREARVGYTRWGAHAKASQLEQLFPELHARSVLAARSTRRSSCWT